jgi:KDO2-lipid IV(A) lauroyltransferase
MSRQRQRTERAQAIRWRLEAAGVLGGIRILDRLPSLARGEILDRVEFEGLPELASAFSRGRGVLVASAHYGFWELILPALRHRVGNPHLTAVGRAQRNPHLRALISERRRLGDGAEPLPQDARAVLRTLRGNGGVGLLADHYLSPRRGGLLAPFLGRRAWTNPGPARLALHSGSALLLGHTRPLARGGHLVALGPEIAPPQTGDRLRDIAVMTERVNAAIGEWIRERPEPWLWFHGRFRGSPDIDSDAYERARAP